jgi:uncharacterized protein (TIGR03086 family)
VLWTGRLGRRPGSRFLGESFEEVGEVAAGEAPFEGRGNVLVAALEGEQARLDLGEIDESRVDALQSFGFSKYMDRETMRTACASTERFVEGVSPGQYQLPTPCAAWNVRELLNHLLGTLVLGQALLSDTPPAIDVAPGLLPGADLVGDDPLGAYRAGVASLLAAAGGDAVSRTHATPLGEMPGPVLAGFTALDIVVHGWDLGKATGQQPELDAGLAEQVLGFARSTISDEMGTRAPRIGPEVPAAPDAPAADRLVAFLGRNP